MKHPAQLGKYRITEVLGEGAMGVVYKAFDPDIQRVVALKTIRQGMGAQDDSLAMRFRNEAQAAGRLSHPGIVSVYDFARDDDVAYIAMEYVEGRSLAQVLAAGARFTEADIAGLMSQLLEALHHAHEQGVWHRDVKPANVILARNGRLKVADFGIARIESAGLTQTAMMIGTPSYMAPEQLLGSPIDRRVDVYAAGVLLYLLLTGRPPFVGPAETLMYKVVHEPPVPPSEVEGVQRPRTYDGPVAIALAKDPGLRYPTARAFKAAIEAAVGEPIDPTAWDKTLIGVPLRRPEPADPSAARAAAGVHGSGASAARPATDAGTPGASAAGPGGGYAAGHGAAHASGNHGAAGGMGAPTGVAAPGAGGSSGTGHAFATGTTSHWDAATLREAETSLTRFVGPLAGVLVRRAARDSHDVTTLYARMADQVTDPTARAAFIEHASRKGAPVGTPTQTQIHPLPAIAAAAPIHPEMQDAARKLLAVHLGPIAGIVVKKAAQAARDRNEFFTALADTVPDPTARQKLLDGLAKLLGG